MSKIYEEVNKYYTNKINKFGSIPQGADWNGEESQNLRFVQLLKIINTQNFSINDIGCGYGKLLEFINTLNYDYKNYFGFDISESMIKSANKYKKEKNLEKNATFIKIDNLESLKKSDYSIASGIFNVKMDFSSDEWLEYILKTLEVINKNSIKGFSFNILTKYSDKEFMKDNLYYADPLMIFDYCKKNFSKNIALLHDYDLYEFTILVKKD